MCLFLIVLCIYILTYTYTYIHTQNYADSHNKCREVTESSGRKTGVSGCILPSSNVCIKLFQFHLVVCATSGK